MNGKARYWRSIFTLSCTILIAVNPLRVQANQVDALLDALRDKPTDRAILAQLISVIPSITNPEDRCWPGVIYSLGCLAHGDEDAGYQARARLLNSFPTNPMVDYLRSDAIGEKCPLCVDGQVNIKCQKCNGDRQCNKCGGRKIVTAAGIGGQRTVKCMSCGGSGHCSACDGAGTSKSSCSRCNGRGIALSKSKCHDAYEQLLHMPKIQTPVLDAPINTTVSDNFDSVINDLTGRIRINLKERKITKLAVTRIYFNGSPLAPIAKYIQKKVVGGLLNGADSDLEIMERQDLRLMVEENTLQWMIEGKTVPGFVDSHAVLTGEILWDKGLGQALISLRAIDTKSGQLICAPARVITLNTDLRERLGVPSTEPAGGMLIVKPSIEVAAGPLTAKLTSAKENIALANSDTIPEKYRFSYRILSALLAEHLASQGLLLLEREFLFQVACEQAAAQKELNTVLVADTVLQVDVDESTSIDNPVFFIRAVRRQDGRLLGQSEFRLTRSETSLRMSGNSKGQMGTPGADEALADVIAARKRVTQVSQADSVVFTESFRLSDSMRIDDSIAELVSKSSINEVRNSTELYGISDDSESDWVESFAARDCTKATIDGRAVMDAHIQALMSNPQNQNVTTLKARMLVTAALGFGVKIRDQEEFYPGPLNIIACRIAQQYSVAPDASPCAQYWIDVIADVRPDRYQTERSFATQWVRSLDPSLPRGRTNIDAVRGRCKIDRSSFEFVFVSGERQQPDAIFDYSVKTTWSGKYPAEVTITIDLTPMKNRLKKVITTDNSQK